jgi:hypothetical protein
VNKGRIASILGLVLLVILVVSGCGGGDEESLTKSEYVRKGNAICGKWQQARGDVFRKLNQELKPPVTQAKKEKAVLLVLSPYETAVEELAELSFPEKEGQKAEEVVEAMEDGVSQAKANPGTLMSSTLPFAKSNQLADDFGLTECTV